MMVKVSIVSVFNEEGNIEKTISNVLNQTLDDIELIFITENPQESSVDLSRSDSADFNEESAENESESIPSQDSATENVDNEIDEDDGLEPEEVPKTLFDILSEYESQYDFIKLFTEENDLSKAYNLAINDAMGEYIAFLNPEDSFIEEDALERLYSVAFLNNADMASANIMLINSEDEIVSFEDIINFSQNKFSPFSLSNHISEDAIIAPEEYGIPWAVNKDIYRREFLIGNDISFPDLQSGHEAAFLADALSKVESIYAVPVDFYAYNNVRFSGFNRKSFNFIDFDQCNTKEKRFDHIHYKMVFDSLNDSRFDEIRHQFRFSSISFIDMAGIEGGKDILDAYHEVFRDEPRQLPILMNDSISSIRMMS